MKYFETHPTRLIGVLDYGKTFGEIYSPLFFKHHQDQVPSPISGENTKPREKEKINDPVKIEKTEESSYNLS